MSHLYALLGNRIAHLRRQADLTQEQLAEKTGYSVDFIGLVERGINAPTVKRLKDIADVLGVEVCQLFKAPEDNQTNAGGRRPRRRKRAR